VHDAAFQPPRLVDDSFEQAADRLRPERALARDLAHVLQDLLLALGLIDLDAELLFQLADFAGAARPLVEKAHQHLVDAIDVLPEVVECPHGHMARGTPCPPAQIAASFNDRT
jgi:hypothetical protein